VSIQEICNGEREFQLRIGIHLGEVIFENGDVFGDGVNVASRIQALASPGTTWVSEIVFRNIENKRGISTDFIKETTLKNVQYPVCFDFPVGHQKNNFALKCGIKHRLDVKEDAVSLKEISPSGN